MGRISDQQLRYFRTSAEAAGRLTLMGATIASMVDEIMIGRVPPEDDYAPTLATDGSPALDALIAKVDRQGTRISVLEHAHSKLGAPSTDDAPQRIRARLDRLEGAHDDDTAKAESLQDQLQEMAIEIGTIYKRIEAGDVDRREIAGRVAENAAQTLKDGHTSGMASGARMDKLFRRIIALEDAQGTSERTTGGKVHMVADGPGVTPAGTMIDDEYSRSEFYREMFAHSADLARRSDAMRDSLRRMADGDTTIPDCADCAIVGITDR